MFLIRVLEAVMAGGVIGGTLGTQMVLGAGHAGIEVANVPDFGDDAMKPALIVITAVLLLSGCSTHKTAVTNSTQGNSDISNSKTTTTQTSNKQKVENPDKRSAHKGSLIEDESGDPNNSALNVHMHP